MKKIKSDNLLSFSAIFISICTLMVFLYQTNLIRKQQFMSVYPHLTLQNFGTLTENYSFVLKNDGIGPAIIESVQVKTKANETFEDLLPFVADRIIKMQDSTIGFYHTNMYPGQLIPAESKIDLILDLLDQIDLVLIMSVNPGFGGQKFMPEVLDKIKELKKIREQKKLDFDIEIDGGINFDNCKSAIDAGANILVSGTTVFKSNDGDIKKNINLLKLK